MSEQCSKPERGAPTSVIEYFAIVTLSRPRAHTFSRIIAYAVKICYQRPLQNIMTVLRLTEAWRTSLPHRRNDSMANHCDGDIYLAMRISENRMSMNLNFELADISNIQSDNEHK